MSENTFTDLVFSLTDKEFELLEETVNRRRNKNKYGVTNFEELAVKYERKPTCPKCESDNHISFGHTSQHLPRYQCQECGKKYGLMRIVHLYT